MLTVMELLSFPLFRGFRLAAGYGGLYNQVKGTGILEWESSSDVEKSFEEGEFVVTTLSLSRNDASLAESRIRMLIDKKVSAVAVKDIYFHGISDELKAYSDDRQIPVFFFSETFFDDIIFTIKSALIMQNREDTHTDEIDFLLDPSATPEQKKRKAREINPFFHQGIICCFASLKKDLPWRDGLTALQPDPEETVYSIFEYRQGLLVIYTVNDPAVSGNHLASRLMDFLDQSGISANSCEVGISNPAEGLENLCTAIQESIYAHTSCRMEGFERIRFGDTGLDRILLPLADSPWGMSYYSSLCEKIMEHDARHGAKLMDTLLVYIENDRDMAKTAQKMFQHSNTIRYRIDKIRKLLDLGNDAEASVQLQIFVRLHRIYRAPGLLQGSVVSK